MCLGGIMAQLVTHNAEVDKATVVWNFLSSESERVKNCGGDSDTTRYVNTHISRGDSGVVRHGGGAIAAIDIGPSQRQALPHRGSLGSKVETVGSEQACMRVTAHMVALVVMMVEAAIREDTEVTRTHHLLHLGRRRNQDR